ncbi:GAF and ANTAR domain-containing protein [Streptomyces violascens]|uniref:GAF and ANTAR domain-containing protein n=1 Tax=Streptomyces violascens TaxID=67381 RepID=UPI0036576D8A
MAAPMESWGEAGRLLRIALQRATRAAERARQQTEFAERHERLAARTGREFHRSMAATHRRIAERHLTTASLQHSYAASLAAWSTGHGDRPRFMAEVAAACGTASAALTLIDSDLNQLAVATSDQLARDAQDLEYVLGIGPAREAAEHKQPVLASGAALDGRWPGYGTGLDSLGLCSVAALPLKAPNGCIGALTLFDPLPGRAETGELDEVAGAVTDNVLLGPDADPDLYGGVDLRAVVHQAAGMMSGRTHCSVDEALALIKARAFARGESAEAVARRIVYEAMDLD